MGILLKQPVSFIKSYIALAEDRSVVAKLQYKAEDIAAKLHMRPSPYSGKVRVYDMKKNPIGQGSGVVVFIDISNK